MLEIRDSTLCQQVPSEIIPKDCNEVIYSRMKEIEENTEGGYKPEDYGWIVWVEKEDDPVEIGIIPTIATTAEELTWDFVDYFPKVDMYQITNIVSDGFGIIYFVTGKNMPERLNELCHLKFKEESKETL